MQNKCSICRKEISQLCDWNQGRCPHRTPLIDLGKLKMEIQPKDTSRGHFYVSLVKSALRIVAGCCFVTAGYSVMHGGWLVAGGALLILAEVLGIVEELV